LSVTIIIIIIIIIMPSWHYILLYHHSHHRDNVLRLMGVPTSEVGYTPVMPRREDHEVHKDMRWHWTKKK